MRSAHDGPETAPEDASRPPAAVPPRRVLPLLIVGSTALAGLIAAWAALRDDPARPTRVPAGREPFRASRARGERVFDSPFLNAKPGVRYVGSATCTRCHADIAESFRRHPMGRSAAQVSAAELKESAGSFQAQGFEYAVELRGENVVHRETRRDQSGRVVAERAEPVLFAVGSGRGGKTFLFERDGFLFESPVSWFTQAGRWDLSPGYEKDNSHFERGVGEDCLYCHVNRALPVQGTTNRYRAPIVEGPAIGCERCHGPGELHVERQELHDGKDLTIVNPRHLDPVRRDSVCQQCHLKGDFRVLHAGRAQDDFRPGLPIHRFWSVFFRPSKLVEQVQAVGHVEQMEASRCYEASRGKLGCISCHDPHRLPAPEERVEYFRARCLECHTDLGCALPETTRRARNREDSCVDCHMPRSATTDIAHTATTLHRIPRRPEDKPRLPERFQRVNLERDYLALYQQDQGGAREAARDRAVALATAAWSLRGTPVAEWLARQALPTLEIVWRVEPDDRLAWELAGVSLWLADRPDDALPVFQSLLREAPERENALLANAGLAAQLGQRDQAVALLRRALALNPWSSFGWFMLANLHAEGGDWNATADACRQVLRANPAHLAARRLLAQALVRSGEGESGRAEFQRLLDFDPPNRAELLRWFDEEQAHGQPSP